MSADDTAYRVGAFLRKAVDSANGLVDTIGGSLDDDIDNEIDGASTTMEDHTLDHILDETHTEDSHDYGVSGIDRFCVMSFQDNSQIVWLINPEQRTSDALTVCVERFKKNAEDFVKKNNQYHDGVIVVSTVKDQVSYAISVIYTDKGFRHGDVLTIIDLKEQTAVNHDGRVDPKVPYNPYDSRWPWSCEDKSKYRYASRSLRMN
jgi:hypothetical protein